MDANNWRPTAPGREPVMDTGDWRTQLQPDSRQRIVNKIMDTLKRHLPFSGQEGLQELKKIAVRFEEKIYTAATNQSDYLRKISLKMLTMETKSQNTISTGNGNKTLDPGASHSMPPQVHNQSHPNSLSANQSQVRQQLSQNMQNSMSSNGVQSSAGLQSAMPSVPGLTQTIPNTVGQNANMQSISGVSQNPVGNSMGQGIPSNMFVNSQRQMPGRQQVIPPQQSQNPQQYLYQQHQQLLKQKLQQGNHPHSLVQSHIQQQQQQQNLLQPNQLQSSQQSSLQTSTVMQPSMMQTVSGLQQNQPSSVQQSTQPMHQQHPQSVLRQQQQQPQQSAGIHQQQTPMMQQPLLPPQQQLMGQQSNTTNMSQNQLIGQQNIVGDLQQQQQQQRLLGQQNNLQNLQQQQLMAQQNNLSSMHQQQLGPQSNVTGLQQQQLHGAQPGNSSMQSNQHSLHMLQQPKVTLQQQAQQSGSALLLNQGQQSHSQLPQQQLMAQIQSQPGQLQQQSNPLQRDMQQRLQASGSLLQQPSVIDQQKQLYQPQRALPETSSTSLDSTAETGHANGAAWQEEISQKIKVMKETYLPDINEMYQRIATKLQQHDPLPQQPKSEQLEKLKVFKVMLERVIAFLQVSKNNITLNFKEKLGFYEKQILGFLNPSRYRKPVPNLQQGQLPQPHIQPMQQPQSQVPQLQSHENQLNPQLQSMNMQASVPKMQQNNMSSLLHNSLSSLSGDSTSQSNMMNPIQPGSNLDSGQGNALSSLQQTPVGSVQQNLVSISQPTNVNTMSTQSGVSMLQPNIPLQSNSNMIQHQHLKQQQHDQQMLQTQQLKRFQQRQNLIQNQQMLQQQQQQLHQQAKQQLPAQMQTHQIPQPQQMNDINEMRQGIGIKPAVFQQHLPTGQRTAFPRQHMKPAPSFPISSPQLPQHASPQLQHSSPQIDQQNLPSSVTKTGTPLQSANSPFVVPSPSTPLAPSPMPGDSDKPVSGISSLVNTGNIVHQPSVAQAAAPSLAIGTPGISASPLLAEFTSPDGAHGGALTTVSGKSNVTEQPLERLIKAVKSLSPKALSASVGDIGSVVSMIDRITGSAAGNGSKAAAGEDLVAMTKCRLQARNYITQDGMTGSRKMRRHTSAMPLNVVSSAGSVSDSFKQFTGPETSDLESTATSSVKRPRIEANHALLEEIREINQRLIDTVVDISDEDVDSTAVAATAEGGEGTIVKCSFSAVALSQNLKSQYASAQMSPIQPLRLLVPTNYPSCSPILLDRFPVEVSKEYEDLSIKAKSRFSISLRSLSQPMSLGEIARTWDVCARVVISEHAQQSGGGTFSSKYGSWENCLSAA
ncbi:PREDICTED: mediator of RNA polymerase II transcription subunit 15a-like isoform X2 [Populus euphratica]|uniref:Mediator of RNA polymerase II transcription subunit 15a-like isoform X2 n=4 Tax=Populus euphratica TaxID=75702 RepID=A0AAJ6VBN3_POPEU|nr:PREDICTED: mediator of RNA polymerase II transcription subunit 15a-like isoform X2 [Populus euphratica]XP_011044889.1 PREDICTED: mediator of RNA polymerase II transcription subunit 15a-like isoform X2 [Populus euphratica]XP_011044890.1 PREDICTED: mediator of RNA polymerase II transcription subunit 15a-like isoform X2 [Populus euphratica]XP_011044891.1 PREDICTED: mediator of RNA polymerase II transcription subunit 15a-like isoform X2 [Populus euphratica]